MGKGHEKEIREAFLSYLDDYFHQRDFERTIAHFGRHISGFGSSRDENTYTYERCYETFKRDIEEVPNRIDYEIKELNISSHLEDIGFLSCELDIWTTIRGQTLRFNDLRYTLAFIREKGRWLIEQKHLSLPSTENEEDEPYPIKELEERNKVLHRMVDEKTKELNSSLETISELANNDYLTGIANRYRINKILKGLIERVSEEPGAFSVILMDLDDFKSVNDTSGHLTGDEFLVKTARFLEKHCGEDGIVGRWGGDEFIVIYPDKTEKAALVYGEKLRNAYERAFCDEGYSLTMSLGVSEYCPGDNIETIISRCDRGVYAAKAKGKNSLCVE